MSSENAAVIGQILTFLAVIAGFIFQYFRDAQQHRWDEDQRVKIAARLLAGQHETAAHLANETASSEARLTAHIETNTDLSRVAFKEANDVNMKIHALGLDARLQKAKFEAEDDGA